MLVHDLRSPLSVVKANTKWVADQLPGHLEPDVAAEAAEASDRNIKLEVECQSAEVVADPALLTRALENLTSNALRYTPKGGRIQLFVGSSDDGVQVAVRNDGAGIAPQQRTQLFEKFQQLGTNEDRRTSGFGLGLYFCRLVAQAHRGVIAVEDAPGWATSMVMRLPVAKSVAVAA